MASPAAGDQVFGAAPSAPAEPVHHGRELSSAALAAPGAPLSANIDLSNDLSNVLLDLDQGLGRVLEVRAGIGSRLSAIEAQETMLGATDVDLRRALSGLRDTDYASALTRMQQHLTSLEAAQKSFVRASDLSLFDYL